jgi:glyoxylase-like metal-dependent hydrolase (beta-lactamase superfamily II)
MSIHALVVDTGARRIVVDTCIGNDKQRSIPNWSNLQTSFLQDLESAGYPRESIDTVLCTHLHVDHVGWNTMLVNGEWVPTFPNARYLLAQPEFEYWDQAEADALNDGVMADSVRPVVEAGLVDLIDWEHQVCEEVSLTPTPGHTPGHVSIAIRSEGCEALITGDCFHHPCQMTRVDWCSSADYDQSQGQRTREALLDRYSGSDVLIIGTHFATPTAGRIRERAEGGYWLDVG